MAFLNKVSKSTVVDESIQIAEYIFNCNKTIVFELKNKVSGLGVRSSTDLLNKLQINPYKKFKDLTEEEKTTLEKSLNLNNLMQLNLCSYLCNKPGNKEQLIGDNLKIAQKKSILHLQKIKCRKGYRFEKKLKKVNGQRTRSTGRGHCSLLNTKSPKKKVTFNKRKYLSSKKQ